MGLISGSVACCRYNVTTMPESIDFESFAFRAIQPGSSLRERHGFVPYEPGETYEVGHGRWAFRVRFDKVHLDSTTINERLKELIKIETENAGPPSAKTIQSLKRLAEDEQMERPMTKSKIIECYIDGTLLYIGATSKNYLGSILELLRNVGVEAEVKNPWMDEGFREEEGEHLEVKEPGQSVRGCRFLQALLNDRDVMVEPEAGNVKLVTDEGAKVGLAGPVNNELDRYLDRGSEVVMAKLLVGEMQFTLDGFSYKLSGLALDNYKKLHWIERLEARMEKIAYVWDFLDAKYQLLMSTDPKKQVRMPAPPPRRNQLGDLEEPVEVDVSPNDVPPGETPSDAEVGGVAGSLPLSTDGAGARTEGDADPVEESPLQEEQNEPAEVDPSAYNEILADEENYEDEEDPF